MEIEQGKLITYGLDYLRLTWPIHSEELEAAQNLVVGRLEELLEEGEDVKERRFKQFVGAGSKHLGWLKSNTHVMCDISGSEAHYTGQRIIDAGLSGKCTRIDTQGTADYGERELRFAERLRDSLRGREARVGQNARSTNAHFETPRGDTGIAINARIGETHGRAYHAASKHPGLYPPGAWRFEIEWKGARARECWRSARIAANLGAFAASRAAGQFMAWGIKEPWMLESLPERVPIHSTPRSNEKTFRWLNSQVASVVHRLLNEGEHEEVELFLYNCRNYPKSDVAHNRRLESANNVAKLKRER